MGGDIAAPILNCIVGCLWMFGVCFLAFDLVRMCAPTQINGATNFKTEGLGLKVAGNLKQNEYSF